MSDFNIDITRLQILSDGFLPSGYYWYRVVALLPGCELDLASNTVKVFVPYRNNTIGLFWSPVPNAKTYKVFRRTEDGDAGYLLVDSPAFFYDNVLIEFTHEEV